MRINADTTNDGAEALELIKVKNYAVKPHEVHMPNLDGLETTKLIRLILLRKQPFVIAISASTYESDRKIAEKAGMNAFISKPFKFDDLKKSLSLLH